MPTRALDCWPRQLGPWNLRCFSADHLPAFSRRRRTGPTMAPSRHCAPATRAPPRSSAGGSSDGDPSTPLRRRPSPRVGYLNTRRSHCSVSEIGVGDKWVGVVHPQASEPVVAVTNSSENTVTSVGLHPPESAGVLLRQQLPTQAAPFDPSPATHSAGGSALTAAIPVHSCTGRGLRPWATPIADHAGRSALTPSQPPADPDG